MESKKCTKCGEVKQMECFSKYKRNNDGYHPWCKLCQKQYREENKERIAKYQKQYREENKEHLKQWREENKEHLKQWREENKERKAESQKQWREENRERINEHAKQYYEENKEYYKQYRQENKERRKQYYQENKERNKHYYQENKERILEYHKQRRKIDPLYKLKRNLRSRTGDAFKRKSYRKTSKTAKMLGVPFEIAKDHIERQFTKGMTWENHGEWHIDHIIPLASAETESELIKLCHYTNLQPLWAMDNLSKNANVIDGTQVKLRL